jgi:hypothetical protein
MVDESESGAQRRLWFLEQLLEKMDAEKALALAARMEKFVATYGQATIRKDDHRPAAAQNAPAELPAIQAETIAGSLDPSSSAAVPRAPSTMKQDVKRRLLTDAEIQAFMNRAVQGATNRELAHLFGLTPRQANGIRMTLAKRTPQVALRPTAASTPDAVRATADDRPATP